MKTTIGMLMMAVVVGFGVVYFGCQSEPQNVVVEEPKLEIGSDDNGGVEEEPLYTRPLPVIDIPEDIRYAGDFERVREWVDGLTTDDLQRYNIIPSRGADPRNDVPREYENREEVIDKMLRIGLYNAGVEAAEDQSAWLARNMNCEEGLMFARANADGPDWGWSTASERLDDPCSDQVQGVFVERYYIWRAGGAVTGAIIDWSAAGPLSGDNYRTILVGGNIKIAGPKQNYKFCRAEIRYRSQTNLDGRLVRWNGTSNVLESTRMGYCNGFAGVGGKNIRETAAQGVPWWNLVPYSDCTPSCGSGGFIDQPANINPALKYLVREYSGGNNRYYDYTVTQCSYFDEGTTSRIWLRQFESPNCFPGPGTECNLVNGQDLAFFANGSDEEPWTSNLGGPEQFFHNGLDQPAYNDAAITRNVEYKLDALVHHELGIHPVGGWMNQVLYRSDTQNGTYNYFLDDGIIWQQGAPGIGGNSQDFDGWASQDSSDWQNKYIKSGCRPFWLWKAWVGGGGGNVYDYNLQLAQDGDIGCTFNPVAYNRFDLDNQNNPRDCSANGMLVGSVTYDAGGPNHEPWKAHREVFGSNGIASGWLHPSMCFVRQQGNTHDHACARYNSTYYPLKTKLADDAGTTSYPGSYVSIRYNSTPIGNP